MTSAGTRAAISSSVGIWETSYEVVAALVPAALVPAFDPLEDEVGSAQAARGSTAAAASAMRACAFVMVMMCLPMGWGPSAPLLLSLCTYMHNNAYLCVECHVVSRPMD